MGYLNFYPVKSVPRNVCMTSRHTQPSNTMNLIRLQSMKNFRSPPLFIQMAVNSDQSLTKSTAFGNTRFTPIALDGSYTFSRPRRTGFEIVRRNYNKGSMAVLSFLCGRRNTEKLCRWDCCILAAVRSPTRSSWNSVRLLIYPRRPASYCQTYWAKTRSGGVQICIKS